MQHLRSLARSALSALCAATLLPSAAFAASQLDVYALTVGGNSQFGANGNPFGCSTFAPDSGAALFGRTFQLALPTDGAICGVGGVLRSATAAGGSVQVAAPLAVSWGLPTDPRTLTGNAQARAGYGNLGVQAVANYGGTSDNGTVAGAQAGARQIESLTVGGGSGNGIYRQTFTIDGSLFNVGRSDSEIEFGYSYGTIPMRMAFRITSQRGGVVGMYADGSFQPSLPGMTVTGDLGTGFTVAGSTTFSFDIPIVFGVAQDVGLSLWAAILPSSSAGQLTASAGDASFFSTAKLTGIQVFDSGGQAVNNFTVISGSGTLYGPGGVVAVPEPSVALLFCAGLLCLGGLRRRWR
ncbi:PEP-CTERM sorting domain-containing protein [Roseateles sp. P5_E7]